MKLKKARKEYKCYSCKSKINKSDFYGKKIYPLVIQTKKPLKEKRMAALFLLCMVLDIKYQFAKIAFNN